MKSKLTTSNYLEWSVFCTLDVRCPLFNSKCKKLPYHNGPYYCYSTRENGYVAIVFIVTLIILLWVVIVDVYT